jgi:hypothetical protein
MESVLRRLALKIRLNKIENCGIAAPILLNEILAKKGFKTKVVQGFASLKEESAWHVWVECDGVQLDIASTLHQLKNPEEPLSHVSLSETYEEGCPQENPQVTAQWELYQKDSKQFWKEMPAKVQNFRAKILKE